MDYRTWWMDILKEEQIMVVDKELSIRDIRCIGGGRYSRKTYKSAVLWILLLLAGALLISGYVVAFSAPNAQYTLPSGEVVELEGGKLIIGDTIISERNNPTPVWSPGFALVLASLGILIPIVVYIGIQEDRARDKIMEEWLEAGYQPKAKDVL